ncbi:hypothetical protein FH608_040665 [Nonomuraea phyllanthi]|uniref:Uncharacterized protein n=1 Tax=Nonomuraea phyllanthi TaxID=2219224 RepID=A0A5C4VKW2_9ACTN|nr:hypothetical protein [Nonomuraea phyllanthi]KAB8189159.1 hypothetical protein FH608_040665 [Nonomuraea phyllanthi]QFY10249.1 hypothetical protein GBF35_29695 [Nonomuraea phyllanthi]
MYAMIWRYDTGTGSFDEMIKQVDREFADRIPEEVGSVLYAAVNTGEGTALTVTFFPDAEAATRAEATVTGVQQSLADRFGVSPIEVHRGEVLVSRANEAVTVPIRFAG